MSPLTFTLFASFVSIAADTILKSGALKDNKLFLFLGTLIYVFTAFLWFEIYKSNKISTVNIMYSLTLMLMSVIIGVFYFREKLTGQEIIGMMFAIVAVFLLSRHA